MLRSDRNHPGSADPGAGLHALRVLVADALPELSFRAASGAPLLGWGHELALADGPGGPGGPGRPGVRPGVARSGAAHMAIDVSARREGSGTASSGTASSGDGADGSAQRVGDGFDGDDIDEDHVETWRLVARAQDGDGEAFGQLYDRYVDTVFRFIYFRLNDRALAEDFTSETFLRALRRISTISYQGRDIGAWFVTIARNIVLDHIKSARNRLEITTADTIEGNDRADSPEATVLAALTSERLMQAVSQLGDEQRECVMLRFIQGFSVSETAEVMGKNDGAIKALQHRAIRKLAELVGGDLR